MNGIIYKIKNELNGKVYIGLTTTSIETRWNGHKTSARKVINGDVNHPLYNAMVKYGVENFTITKLDETDNFIELGELERKYIKEYKSTDRNYGYNITRGGERNQLDGNPRTNLTVDDVIEIRKIYDECEIGPLDCWEMYYKNRISYSAFEKIYEGKTWLSVMPEVYTLENKTKHKKMCSNPGEKNGNSILSSEKVLEIRKYYVNHTLKECYDKYGENFSSEKSFRSVIDRSYKEVPVYNKVKKEWFFGEKVEKRCQNKSNVIRIKGNVIEIDTIDDYGNKNGVFITNKKYLGLVKSHRWSIFCNGKIYTCTKEKKVVFLHELIMNTGNKRVYYISGNKSDVREENLTTNMTEYKIKKRGLDWFKESCLDERVSLRGMAREFGVSAQSVKRYIDDNNIPVSDNKVRK